VAEHTRTIAICGGTGFVGNHILGAWNRAPQRDVQLRFLVRHEPPTWLRGDAVECRQIDFMDAESSRAALFGCNGLINLLRPDGSGGASEIITRLLGALPAELERMLHVSSIDVYGDAADSVITEATVPQPQSAYAREHLDMERAVAEAAFPSTVLRLGAVFGVGGRNLLRMAEQVAREPQWKLALRRSINGRRRFHLVGADFAAQVIVSLSQGNRPLPPVILVTEDADEDNNFAFVQERFAAAMGRRVPAVGFAPAIVLKAASGLLRRRVQDPQRRFPNTQLAALDIMPSRPFREGIDSYARHMAHALQRDTQ